MKNNESKIIIMKNTQSAAFQSSGRGLFKFHYIVFIKTRICIKIRSLVISVSSNFVIVLTVNYNGIIDNYW